MKENRIKHKIVIYIERMGEGKGIVSSLLLCQNTRKVGSIVESETISVSFSFRLKSTSLSYTLSGCHILVSEKAMAPHSSTLAWKIMDRGAW